MALINLLVEVVIGLLSEYFNRPRNYAHIQLEVMSGIVVIQYINLGIMFIVVRFYSDLFAFKGYLAKEELKLFDHIKVLEGK